jgi:hypothetical protein
MSLPPIDLFSARTTNMTAPPPLTGLRVLEFAGLAPGTLPLRPRPLQSHHLTSPRTFRRPPPSRQRRLSPPHRPRLSLDPSTNLRPPNTTQSLHSRGPKVTLRNIPHQIPNPQCRHSNRSLPAGRARETRSRARRVAEVE